MSLIGIQLNSRHVTSNKISLWSSKRLCLYRSWPTKPVSTQKLSNNGHLDTCGDWEPQIVLVSCVKLLIIFSRRFHWSTRRCSWEIQLMYVYRRALRWEFRCLCKQPTQHEHGIMITTDVLDCLRSNVLFPEILSWEGREPGEACDRKLVPIGLIDSRPTMVRVSRTPRPIIHAEHTALTHYLLFPKHHPSMFHCYRWTSSSFNLSRLSVNFAF